MIESVTRGIRHYLGGMSRRDLFRRGSILAGAPVFFRRPTTAAPAVANVGKLQLAPSNTYQSVGVRRINCRGTLTVISGSMELPEVQAAAQHHVVLDELMEGVAQRLAEITGAEWALVPAGCAAGIAHATAACVSGRNPDLHVRIPDLMRLGTAAVQKVTRWKWSRSSNQSAG